jgi:hypothetical protein
MGRSLPFHACRRLIHQEFKGQALTLALRAATVTRSDRNARPESGWTNVCLLPQDNWNAARGQETRPRVIAIGDAVYT